MTRREKTRTQIWMSICLVLLAKKPHLSGAQSCGANITDLASGRVTSPLYPENYPRNSDCKWRLTSTAGQEIRLNIEHLNVKEQFPGDEKEKCFDKLDMYHVRSGKLYKISDDLCASSIAELQKTEFVINSTSSGSNVVMIYFTSDYSDEFSGFSISFQMYVEPTTEAITTETIATEVTEVITTTAPLQLEPVTNASLVIGFVDPKKQKEQNSSVTYILIGAGLACLLLIFVIIFVVFKKRRKQVPPQNAVIFQNIPEEMDDMGTDEYGRARENTYVEIPLLPNEEMEPLFNGARTSITLRRNSSASSFDSISKAKLEIALADNPERLASTSSNVHSQANQADPGSVYKMAEENEDHIDNTYMRPSSIKIKENQFNEVYTMADEHTGSDETDGGNLQSCNFAANNNTNTEVKKEPVENDNVPVMPESVYDVPSSPPCDPPSRNTESFYDRPRIHPGSKFSFKSEMQEEPSIIETENKYCTMRGSVAESKSSPSNSLSSGSGRGDAKEVEDSAVYMPMMSQK